MDRSRSLWQRYLPDGRTVAAHHGSLGHPEMAAFEDELRETVRSGDRRQDSLNPGKYRYTRKFDRLAEENTHIVAVVLFKSIETAQGPPVSNNFIVTAYQKEVT